MELNCKTRGKRYGMVGNCPSAFGNVNADILDAKNVMVFKFDWDSYETSWDFKQNLLMGGKR